MVPLLTAAANSDIVKKGALILGGVAVFGIGYWVVNRRLKKSREEKARQAYLSKVGTNSAQGRASGYAVLLRNSMKGMGTREKPLFQSLEDMKNEGIKFSEVSAAYKALYNRDLYLDMDRELRTKEMAKANSIIQLKGLV